MKRFILSVMLLSSVVMGVSPASAQDIYYQGGYPVAAPIAYQGGYPTGYPTGYPVQQAQGNQVLQKVLVGGALLGAGFLAGRLTAPNNYGYGGYAPPPVVRPYPVNYGGGYGHHGGGHAHHGPQPGFNGRW